MKLQYLSFWSVVVFFVRYFGIKSHAIMMISMQCCQLLILLNQLAKKLCIYQNVSVLIKMAILRIQFKVVGNTMHEVGNTAQWFQVFLFHNHTLFLFLFRDNYHTIRSFYMFDVCTNLSLFRRGREGQKANRALQLFGVCRVNNC